MLNALIIDDEAPARSELRFMLAESKQIEVIAEAASAREAVEKLKQRPYDVVFLDINMPEMTGMQLADKFKSLTSPPAIVFVSAYDRFAVDAFEANAIDYLVKPVEERRLSTAINRVRKHVLLREKNLHSKRIPVEKGDKKALIKIDEIRFAKAHDDYVYLQTDTNRYLLGTSLTQLENRFAEHGFFRAHRCYLVNLSAIEKAETTPDGKMLLRLNGIEDSVPVSRRRVSDLRKALVN